MSEKTCPICERAMEIGTTFAAGGPREHYFCNPCDLRVGKDSADRLPRRSERAGEIAEEMRALPRSVPNGSSHTVTEDPGGWLLLWRDIEPLVRRLESLTEPRKVQVRAFAVEGSDGLLGLYLDPTVAAKAAQEHDGATTVMRWPLHGAPEPEKRECATCTEPAVARYCESCLETEMCGRCDTIERLRQERDAAMDRFVPERKRAEKAEREMDDLRDLAHSVRKIAEAGLAGDVMLERRVVKLESAVAYLTRREETKDVSDNMGNDTTTGGQTDKGQRNPVADALRSCSDCARCGPCSLVLGEARKWGTPCDEFEMETGDHVARALDWYELRNTSSDRGVQRALIAAVSALSDRVTRHEEQRADDEFRQDEELLRLNRRVMRLEDTP
jgi:hypothetical protein